LRGARAFAFPGTRRLPLCHRAERDPDHRDHQLLTVWFGFDIAPKIMICSIISFFPIATNTTRGLKATDRRIGEFTRPINATPSEILLKVQFPSALPLCPNPSASQ
jgi:hypothetical protein